METYLETLSSAAELLSSLSFTHPVAFQNTLLSRRDITTVIRDAEPHESKLFMLSPETQRPTKRTGKALAHPATDILKSKIDSTTAPDVDTLLAAAEQLLHVYPVDSESIQAEVDLIRHKYMTIKQSIASLESDVDIQRRKLDALASGREYNEDDDYDEDAEKMSGTQEVLEVTDEMLAAEEEEIRRLEQLIEEKSKR